MPEYFFALLLIFVVTLSLHFKFKIKLYKSKAHFFITNSIFVIVAIVWDHIAITRGHWSFDEKFLLGPKIGIMPIEEFGFTLIMAYFGFVLYRLVEKKLNR
jgi:lycopene beta-cyclase